MIGTGHVGAAVEREGAVELAHPHGLPRRAATPREERAHDAERREHARHVGDHRRDEPDRPPRPRPLHGLDTRHRGDERFLRRETPRRPCIAPRDDAACDEPVPRLHRWPLLVRQRHVGAAHTGVPADRVDRALAALEDGGCGRPAGAGGLDRDHVGAERGEEESRERAGKPLGPLDHANARKRRRFSRHQCARRSSIAPA